MTHFDISGMDIESLVKVLGSSFPDRRYRVKDLTSLVFEEITESEANKISKLITLLKMTKTIGDERSKFRPSYDTDNATPKSYIDVNLELESIGDLTWIGEGMPLFKGDFLRVKRALEKYWFEYATNELGCVEIENPALWSQDLALKSEYLKDFPHEATFIFGSLKTSDALESMLNAFEAEDLPLPTSLSDFIKNGSASFIGLCQPSVCTSCYYALGLNKVLKNQNYTTYNRVFRNEGTKKLDRLLSFTVRDLIAIGDAKFVQNERDRFIQKAERFIVEINLEAQVVQATDPFFMANAQKLFMQKTGHLKHEIQAWIPFEQSPIAVGSVNLHLKSFGSRFNIMTESEVASSACFGIGFERLSYALFAQKGLDIRNWDEKTKSTLELG